MYSIGTKTLGVANDILVSLVVSSAAPNIFPRIKRADIRTGTPACPRFSQYRQTQAAKKCTYALFLGCPKLQADPLPVHHQILRSSLHHPAGPPRRAVSGPWVPILGQASGKSQSRVPVLYFSGQEECKYRYNLVGPGEVESHRNLTKKLAGYRGRRNKRMGGHLRSYHRHWCGPQAGSSRRLRVGPQDARGRLPSHKQFWHRTSCRMKRTRSGNIYDIPIEGA